MCNSADHCGGERLDLMDESKPICHSDETRRRLVKEILGHVGYYYRIEARSLMELALWKMKMGELHVDSNFIDRASCRYRFVAEDVVKSVAAYLWDQELHAYHTAISTYAQLDFYKVHPDSDLDSSDSESSETGSYAETVWPDTSTSDSRSSSEYDSDASGDELDSSSSSSESSDSEESQSESEADSFSDTSDSSDDL